MKLLLCILDGVGIRKEKVGNAVKKANMPNFNKLLKEYPHSLLEASGTLVGLPVGQMGNSEVGHTNIGAGRIVYQPLELINNKIDTKEFYQNDNILEVINHTKKNNSKLHIMGLLSDGGVHSHINHLYALLEMCKKEGVEEVYLHMFLDGRDTLATSGLKYLKQLDNKIKQIGIGKICTISGRYYAMDRDNNYDRVLKSYDAIVNGKGEQYKTFEDAIKANLERNITDEFTIPCVINEGKVSNKDGIIFFNYRPDRLRELGASLTNPKFTGFKTKKMNVKLVTMMPVSDEVVNKVAFDHVSLNNTFGEYISDKGLTQLRIAETEKYAHVTYFFDGGVEKNLKGATRKLIPSSKVATYDLKPEMSANKITDYLIKNIDKYDVIILNFANGDMVGHTGNMDATVKALETVDNCLGKIIEKVNETGGTLIVTADHGNSEYMIDKDGNPVTTHSTSKVPFIINKKNIELKDGKLADIAPTMLKLLDLPIPEEMTGDILIKEKKKITFENIFRILSVIFILCFGFYYCFRLAYFYLDAHKENKYVETTLIQKLNKNELVTSGSGLYECDNTKCFKGEVNNNYLFYKGLLWRIVSYNDDTLKLISEESLTTLIPTYQNNDYISIWLDEFKGKLNSEYIESVGLLTEKEFKDSLLDKTYLNNNTYWFLENNKYIDRDNQINDYDYNNYGIRVVITLKGDINVIKGDGTYNSPLLLTNESPSYLRDVNIGSYISFSNYIWRVIDKNEIGVKVVLNELLDEIQYSKYNKSFNLNEKNSIGYYLNNEFYDKLDKNIIKEGTWNIIRYNEQTSYNYKNVVNSVKANVGLMNVGDLFINDFNNYTLMSEKDNLSVYKINPYGLLYLDLKTSERNVRPSIYLDQDALINTGSGYKNDPYIIGD